MTEKELRQRFIDYKAHRITLTEAIEGIETEIEEKAKLNKQIRKGDFSGFCNVCFQHPCNCKK